MCRNSGSDDINGSSQRQPPTTVEVKTSDIPPWMRLLIPPVGCFLLGVLLSPKFLVMALVYALVSARPLYCCARLQNLKKTYSSSDHEYIRVRTQQDIDSALQVHRDLTLQFAMMAVCLWLYEHSRLLCSSSNSNNQQGDDSHAVVHQAFDMARSLVQWEHAVGLAIEPTLQGFLWNHCQWIIVLANAYYAVFHFVVPFGVMARLIVYRKDPRYEFRAGFFIMLFLALILFNLVPTMPPRLMASYKMEYIDTQQVTLSEGDATILEPYWNIIDTMKQGETLYDKLHKEGGNPYAAMPSMHTGWALWSCLTWIGTIDANGSLRSRQIQRTLAIGHVVCMVLVIIVTGNHFWLDAAAGATCVMIGRVLAHRLIEWVVRDNSLMSRLFQRWRHSSWAATLERYSGGLLSSSQHSIMNNSSSSNNNKWRDEDEYDDELNISLTASTTSQSPSSHDGASGISMV